MAVDGGTANVKQLATTQQKKHIHNSKVPLASKIQNDQSEVHQQAPQSLQRHRENGTRTTYVEDTNVMVGLS